MKDILINLIRLNIQAMFSDNSEMVKQIETHAFHVKFGFRLITDFSPQVQICINYQLLIMELDG